jgi:hypothetical protein
MTLETYTEPESEKKTRGTPKIRMTVLTRDLAMISDVGGTGGTSDKMPRDRLHPNPIASIFEPSARLQPVSAVSADVTSNGHSPVGIA